MGWICVALRDTFLKVKTALPTKLDSHSKNRAHAAKYPVPGPLLRVKGSNRRQLADIDSQSTPEKVECTSAYELPCPTAN